MMTWYYLAGFFALTTYVLAVSVLAPKWRQRVVVATLLAGIGGVITYNATRQRDTVVASEFARAVDLEPIQSIVVQTNGRLKSFDSFARTMMRWVSGSRKIAGQVQAFTYLDMMFRPEAYENADVIYVKKKQIRRRLRDKLAQNDSVEMAVLDTFMDTGLISPTLLRTPVIRDELEHMEQDLIKTARPANDIQTALSVSSPMSLSRNLRIIPPPGGESKDAWYIGEDVWGPLHLDDAHDLHLAGRVPGFDGELAETLSRTWTELIAAWRAQDAETVNTLLARFAPMVRSIEPSLYPDSERIQLENTYFRYKSMTWIWIVYALTVVPLLMSVIYRWASVRRVGVAMFIFSFGLHTASLAIRWYISGRIPNSNMFEAILAASWFGGVAAFVLEFLTRKTLMRSVFFLGSACASMIASMCANFMPSTLTPDINNIMPILLHNVWLYIHTNMIIWSYCMIFMAAVTSILYLILRLGGSPPDSAVLGGAGSLIMRGKKSFITGGKATFAQVLDGATMVMMEISFISLWTGLVMGAIWADQSWGRPWGWDPKEVFALNTFIVFLILVHVRYKVRDKGLWTATLAAVGCVVMLFNWIVVNFVITGLHSYA